MNILFIGQTIPDKILKENFTDTSNLNNMAGNHFYNNMLDGFCKNNCYVETISMVPKNIIKKYGKKFCESTITYHLKVFYSFSPLRYLAMFFRAFLFTFGWCRKNPFSDSIIITNCLRVTQCAGAMLACKILKRKMITVVTDVPRHRLNQAETFLEKFLDKVAADLLQYYSGYVLLSEYMNKIVNPCAKPYIVIEGMICCDESITKVQYKKYDTFTLMYAGSLERKYNILNLVKAVLDCDENVRLILYGKGELTDELRRISDKNSKIDFRGFASPQKILEEEKKVHLLVNPRLSSEEYTWYSFPSKNLEYMASGTPVLFTKLKSMPKEYYPYVFLIDDESANGILKCIENILVLNEEEIFIKGREAKKFVEREKNNIIQVRKIIELIKKI